MPESTNSAMALQWVAALIKAGKLHPAKGPHLSLDHPNPADLTIPQRVANIISAQAMHAELRRHPSEVRLVGTDETNHPYIAEGALRPGKAVIALNPVAPVLGLLPLGARSLIGPEGRLNIRALTLGYTSEVLTNVIVPIPEPETPRMRDGFVVITYAIDGSCTTRRYVPCYVNPSFLIRMLGLRPWSEPCWDEPTPGNLPDADIEAVSRLLTKLVNAYRQTNSKVQE